MSNQPSPGNITSEQSSDKENKKWIEEKLGNLAIYQNGNSFSKSQWSDKGYPIIRIQNLTGEQKEYNYFDGNLDEKYKVENGDILLAWSGTINLFQWEGKNAALNQHIYRVDTEGRINDIFFQFKLEEVIPRLIALSHGSTMKHVRKADLINLDVEIPSDISEQRRIASALYNVDQAIQKKEEIIEQTRRVKKGLMQDLFTEGLYDYEKFQETKIGSLPVKWDFKQLKKYTLEKAFGPRFSSEKYSQKGNVATVRTTDLDDKGNIDKSSMPLANLNREEIESHILREGDLMITRSGTTGIASVWDGYKKITIPGAFLIRFRFKESLDPNYLKQYINSSKGRSRVNRRARGGVQKNLSGEDLMNMKFPIPPLKEQEEIIEVLSQFDISVSHHQEEKERLERVKKGLMQDLLTGKIRTKDKDIEVLDEVLEVEK